MKVKSESGVTQSDMTPWTAAYQAPPSMGFSRQEYWSGVPLPSLFRGLRELKNSPFGDAGSANSPCPLSTCRVSGTTPDARGIPIGQVKKLRLREVK